MIHGAMRSSGLMNDFRAESPALRAAMLEAVRRVLDSGWYVLGREVEAFEREWAATCGARHAVGVATASMPSRSPCGPWASARATRFSLPP